MQLVAVDKMHYELAHLDHVKLATSLRLQVLECLDCIATCCRSHAPSNIPCKTERCLQPVSTPRCDCRLLANPQLWSYQVSEKDITAHLAGRASPLVPLGCLVEPHR